MVRMIRFLVRLAFVMLLLGLGAAVGLFFYGKTQYEAPGPVTADGAPSVVMLDRGMSVRAIAARLEDAGAIDDARFFAIAVRLTGQGGALQAGEYEIPSASSMSQIVSLLTMGKVLLHRLTVAEGLSAIQVVDLLEADPVLTGAVEGPPEEGMVLPETYLFARGTTRAELLGRMQTAKKTLLETLWDQRAEDLPFETAYEALILASIVEKETGVAEERPLVASVFVNRLRKNMLLQSDPTVIYPVTKGRPLGRAIRRSELDDPNPYNTYRNKGLPPTPIANPGRASLEAVLDPPQTDYLYFVADGTGGHAFARTLREHNANVAVWRRIRRERGER